MYTTTAEKAYGIRRVDWCLLIISLTPPQTSFNHPITHYDRSYRQTTHDELVLTLIKGYHDIKKSA